jgi:RNA polymerase sigma factor (TIGR02999 family)
MSGGQVASRDPSRSDITRLLLAWSAGNTTAASAAFSALYAALRELARRALSGERTAHTLGTAGLVSEAFFRLMDQQRVEWRSREHFLATAAQMMRRVLIDHARGRRAAKRGSGVPALPLIDDSWLPGDALDGLVAIHDALEALAAVDPALSELVELRFFGGMTHDEIARYLGISLTTVERRWRLARAWLYRHLTSTSA